MKKGQQGFILIAVLLIMVVVSLLVIGTAFTTVIDRSVAANQQGSTDAYYIAKAGADKYKAVAFQTYRYYLDNLDDYQDELQEGNSACGNFLRIGLDLNRDGDLEDAGDLTSGRTLGPFSEGNGTYTITLEPDTFGQYFILTSIGRVGRSRSTVQLVLEARNAGTTGYALFVGDGKPGNGVIGGVNIYGSAYVTGDKAKFEDFDSTNDYITSGSSFAIHNFYEKSTLTNLFSANAKAKVEEFLHSKFHDQRNLCSTLRIETGRVNIGGNVKLGDTEKTGYKNTISGIHVAEKYATDVTGANVYADLKTGLDIEKVDYPALDAATKSALGEAAGLLVEAGSCGLTSPLEFDSTDVVCKKTDVYGKEVGFEYNATFRQLKVFGLVHLRSLNVIFKQNTKIIIDGEATFFVEDGDVTIKEDLLPSSSFPYGHDVLGIITDGQIILTGKPEGQVVAGVFYSSDEVKDPVLYPNEQEKVKVAEGTTVFGTIITPSFCVTGLPAEPASLCNGTKPANFVKIPDLEYNLPPGFSQLANATVPTFRVASFERR